MNRFISISAQKLNKLNTNLLALPLIFVLMVAPVLSVNAAALQAGDLVKSSQSSTVYAVDADAKTLHPFPHSNVYLSWGHPKNFSTIKTADLSGYEIGNPVEFRSGSLVRSLTNPAVYFIENKTKRPIVSAEVFLSLGLKWENITWLTDEFLSDYPLGETIVSALSHPDGSLVKYKNSKIIYLVENGQKRPFKSDEALKANRYSNKDVITILKKEVYPTGRTITGYEALLALAQGIGRDVGGPPPTQNELTVSLSSQTPQATNIIADPANGAQALAPFASVNFSASSENVKVSTLRFKRIGISSDSSLDSLYLYEGTNRIAPITSVSQGVLTFSNPVGLFNVPAGETRTITLRGTLNKNTSGGNTIGYQIVSVADVVTADTPVKGSFPVSGNLMTVTSISNFGKTSAAVIPVADTVDPNQNGTIMWQATLQTSNQPIRLEWLKFTILGSILPDDLADLGLYHAGSKLASGTINNAHELVFDLRLAPLNFSIGQGKTLEVRGNVVKGSGRTYNFTIQDPTDVLLLDASYNAYISIYPSNLTPGNFSPIQMPNATTIDSGDLSVNKASNSPAGNVPQNGTQVVIGVWTLKAQGEDMGIKNLSFSVATSASNGLANGQLYFNGSQVGSTKDLPENTAVNFTFGSGFVVAAGTSGTLELKADIKTVSGAQLSGGSTILAKLLAGSSNVQRQSSLTLVSRPSQDISANSLTVATTGYTISKNTSYGDQTMVAGAPRARLGSAVLTAGGSEGARATTLTVALSSEEAQAISNLVLEKDGREISSIKSNPSSANTFTVDFEIPASGSVVVDIFADINSSASLGAWSADLSGQGIGLTTGNSLSASSAALQTVTFASSGQLSFSPASARKSSDIILAGVLKQEMNAVQFYAVNESFEVQELTVTVPSGFANNIGKVYLEYPLQSGVSATAEGFLVNNSVAFTGLKFYVPRNENAVVKIYANIPTISNGAASGGEGGLTLSSAGTFRAVGLASGSVDLNASDASGSVQNQSSAAGNPMIVRKTRPSIALSALPSTVLSNGTLTVSKFTVSADANGDAALYKFVWDYSLSGSAGLNVSDAKLYDTSNPGTPLSSTATITPGAGSNGAISFVLASEQVISAGAAKTYFLTLTVSGSAAAGDSVLVRLGNPSTATVTGDAVTVGAGDTSLAWSDMSSVGAHSFASSDWTNGKYVRGLPSDYQVLSR